MTTLTNGEKSIDLTLSNTIKISENKHYDINPPKITCSKFEDAEYMQKEINTFVNNLACELMKNQRKENL